MLRAVDADTHIFESPQVWDFIDAQMYARRPIIVSAPKIGRASCRERV